MRISDLWTCQACQVDRGADPALREKRRLRPDPRPRSRDGRAKPVRRTQTDVSFGLVIVAKATLPRAVLPRRDDIITAPAKRPESSNWFGRSGTRKARGFRRFEDHRQTPEREARSSSLSALSRVGSRQHQPR